MGKKILIGLVVMNTAWTIVSIARYIASIYYIRKREKQLNHKDRPKPNLTETAYFPDPIIYDTKGDAETVLHELKNRLEAYPYVTVYDVYKLSGIKTSNWTMHNCVYCWDSLDGATVKRSSDGKYYIDLPGAKPITYEYNN